MQIKQTLLILLFFCLALPTFAQEAAIKQAIARQMEAYPQATLRDIYKSFFQDKFGPGHIVTDTASAANYLRKELAEMGETHCPYYEQTGYSANFYRVNLSLIKQGIIPFDLFFDAFIRSVIDTRPISLDQWRSEWQQVDSIIAAMNLHLPNYEADRAALNALLAQRKYVVHHSATYNSAYHPHYRLIQRNIFQTNLLPLIPKSAH